jgi:hypothetical protein
MVKFQKENENFLPHLDVDFNQVAIFKPVF